MLNSAMATPAAATMSPSFTEHDLLSLQSWDPAIRTMILHLSAPLVHRISDSDLDCVPDLTHLYHNRTSLRIVKGLLMYVSETLTSPLVVVP